MPKKDYLNLEGANLATSLVDIGSQIQHYTSAADKYFALAGTLLVSALGILSSPGNTSLKSALAIAAPFAIAILLLYVLQLLTERAARVGIRRALESRLRTIAPGHVELERVLAMSCGPDRASARISGVLYGLSLAVSILLAARQIAVGALHLQVFVLMSLVLSMCGLLLALIMALIELTRAQGVAEHQALSQMESRSD